MVKSEFSKTDTKIIKGLAIILMLMHHMWAFPDRLYGGELKHLFTIHGESSISVLGWFGKICVSLFFFLGGYGIYKLSEKKNFNILNNIKKLFINYWKVFLIFIPIGFIFFKNQVIYTEDAYISTVFSNINLRDIINNFLSFSSTLNREWWFLHSYFIAIITFPFVVKLFEKKSVECNLFIVFVFTMFLAYVIPFITSVERLNILTDNMIFRDLFVQPAPYISCFWLGILFAKDNLLVTLKELLNDTVKLNVFTDLIAMMFLVYIRQMVTGDVLDIVYVPLLIVLFLDFVNRFNILKKTFAYIGNHSTNMWLVHTFYCYYFYFFVKIVLYFKWAVPCLIVLFILSLITSIIINYFWKTISNIFIYFKTKLS